VPLITSESEALKGRTWSTTSVARSLKISFKSWIDRTICTISFSRCSTMIELSATKICSCDDAKFYNEQPETDKFITLMRATQHRAENVINTVVCLSPSSPSSSTLYSASLNTFLIIHKRKLQADFSHSGC